MSVRFILDGSITREEILAIQGRQPGPAIPDDQYAEDLFFAGIGTKPNAYILNREDYES